MRIWPKIWAFALIGAAMASSPASAQTEYTTDPYGAQGDAGLDVRCYGDRYVVGVIGRFGTNIDRLRLQCALIGSDGNALPTDQTSVSAGGEGGRPILVTCSPLAYATSIWVELTRSKKQVRFLSADCKSAAGKGKGFSISGAQEAYTYFPGGKFIWYRDWQCPLNMAVTGLRVRYGQHINAIGIICNTIVRQPAPTPVGPPPPARTGPVVPYGAKNGTPRPVRVYPSFAGRWLVNKRSGGMFTLTIAPIDANEVSGTITSVDGAMNGTLVGTVDPDGRTFNLTYRVTATGRMGSGKLTYSSARDLNWMLGGVTTDGTPDVWSGTRQ